jgi:hypothetical protein
MAFREPSDPEIHPPQVIRPNMDGAQPGSGEWWRMQAGKNTLLTTFYGKVEMTPPPATTGELVEWIEKSATATIKAMHENPAEKDLLAYPPELLKTHLIKYAQSLHNWYGFDQKGERQNMLIEVGRLEVLEELMRAMGLYDFSYVKDLFSTVPGFDRPRLEKIPQDAAPLDFGKPNPNERT